MPGRQIRALIANDFRLHGRSVLLVITGALALLAVTTQALERGVGPRVTMVVQFNLFLPLFWSEWLVSRERATQTVAWLRTLPVDDRLVVLAKFLAGAVWCLLLSVLTTAGFAREVWQSPGTGLALVASVLLFNALTMAARWRLNWRMGLIGPMLLVLIPLLLFMSLAGDGTPSRAALLAWWSAPEGPLLTAGALLLLYVGVVVATAAWVHRVETHRLVD